MNSITIAVWWIFVCLAIPMQILAVDGFMARCHAGGIERDVSLFLLQSEPLQRRR